jgi:hypothetical protein
MLIVLVDDIAALGVDAIAIRHFFHSGFGEADFDELKTIMAERHPKIRLRSL